ncbi:Uncharacterized protein Fot_07843 [Forsythia ovata]|uniref:Uncharacterized protein n=1 Tax=Forsythia ovata TaxID=205694 RepID=A0ABD1WX01_9LAMI
MKKCKCYSRVRESKILVKHGEPPAAVKSSDHGRLGPIYEGVRSGHVSCGPSALSNKDWGKVPKAKLSHLYQRLFDQAGCKSKDVHECEQLLSAHQIVEVPNATNDDSHEVPEISISKTVEIINLVQPIDYNKNNASGPPGHSQVGKGQALRSSQPQRGEFDSWMEQLGDVILNYEWSSLVM